MSAPSQQAQSPHLWQFEKFVLASGSATRHAMLREAGLDFIVDPADVDETSLKTTCQREGRNVEETAYQLAWAKAKKISAKRKGMLVLGCDQMLECENVDGNPIWLDKAGNESGARAQLVLLSGKPHRLISAAVLLRDEQILWQSTQTARLHMRALSAEFIDAYVSRSGDALFKSVGCYALEGLGSQLFEQIDGDHFVILGLPLISFLGALRDLGIILK